MGITVSESRVVVNISRNRHPPHRHPLIEKSSDARGVNKCRKNGIPSRNSFGVKSPRWTGNSTTISTLESDSAGDLSRRFFPGNSTQEGPAIGEGEEIDRGESNGMVSSLNIESVGEEALKASTEELRDVGEYEGKRRGEEGGVS